MAHKNATEALKYELLKGARALGKTALAEGSKVARAAGEAVAEKASCLAMEKGWVSRPMSLDELTAALKAKHARGELSAQGLKDALAQIFRSQKG